MATYLPPFVSEFRLQGIAQGREKGLAEGRAQDILRVLDRRGITVDDDSRQAIVSCTDLDTLGTWLDRSLTAVKVTELFA